MARLLAPLELMKTMSTFSFSNHRAQNPAARAARRGAGAQPRGDMRTLRQAR